MFILSNEEVEQALRVQDYLEVLETAFADLAEGRALWRPRTDMSAPQPDGEDIYRLKTMDGIVPRYKAAAIRINSDVINFPLVGGVRREIRRRAARGGCFVGFIIVFDTDTGEPLAMFPDGVAQRMRVGATSGIGAKYLARDDATRLAMIGSGWQAGAQVMAMCAVRPIREVSVFSPSQENREAFAAEMRSVLPGVDIHAVGSADQAIRGADIVSLATNARQPLISWEDIEPGMHVTAIHWPNIDVSLFRRADVVVSNARPVGRWQAGPSDYIYLHDYRMGGESVPTSFGSHGHAAMNPEHPDFVDWYQYPGIGELIAGRCRRRQSRSEVTLHANNIGIALQFAAVGARLVEVARRRGLGHEIPTEWFLETVNP